MRRQKNENDCTQGQQQKNVWRLKKLCYVALTFNQSSEQLRSSPTPEQQNKTRQQAKS
jgi:hypothetical protein